MTALKHVPSTTKNFGVYMHQNPSKSTQQNGNLLPSLRSLLALFGLPLLTTVALAQRSSTSDEEAAAGCFACMSGMVFMVGLVVVYIVAVIALWVWVARDAKSRGMDGSMLWMVLVMLTGPLGLIIYIFSRPQGNLIKCPSCSNKRLQSSAKCPQCGNA